MLLQVYGAGEQYTYFNMRGYDFPIWTREQGKQDTISVPKTTVATAAQLLKPRNNLNVIFNTSGNAKIL